MIGKYEQEMFDIQFANVRSKFTDDRPIVSVKEAADWIGVDPRTLINDKNFPSKKVGKNNIVTKYMLARWLSKNDSLHG